MPELATITSYACSDEPAAEHAEIRPPAPFSVIGERQNGQIVTFVMQSLSANQFSATTYEPLRKSERIMFTFPDFGSITAQLESCFGMDARFLLARPLSAFEIIKIFNASRRRQQVLFSACCGVTPLCY